MRNTETCLMVCYDTFHPILGGFGLTRTSVKRTQSLVDPTNNRPQRKKPTGSARAHLGQEGGPLRWFPCIVSAVSAPLHRVSGLSHVIAHFAAQAWRQE